MAYPNMSVVAFLSLLRLTFPFFEYYRDTQFRKETRTAFFDADLRATFFKANLICNACNGYLIGDDMACLTFKTNECGLNRDRMSLVWQSSYYMATEHPE